MEKATLLAEGFVCKRCKMMMGNEMSAKRLNDDIEIVKGFCYLGKNLNASGGFKITAVAGREIEG